MQKVISIYVSAISRKNGGNSSVLDLAKALILLGHDVRVYTRLGYIDKFVYKVKDFRDFSKVFVNPHKSLRDLNFVQRCFKLLSILQPSRIPDIVIDAELLDSLEFIKEFDNATKILNHAGSIEAFQEFLKDVNVDYLKMIRAYNAFMFQSKVQMEDLKALVGPNKRFFHLYPSISEDQLKFFDNSQTPFRIGSYNIVQVGSIIRRKNQLATLKIAEMLSHMTNVSFHIIGPVVDVDYYMELKEYCALRNLNNVKFYGFREDYPRFIKFSNLVIQVSKSEGLSRIIREAYFYKKPVYSFEIQGIAEVINTKIGRIFDFDNHSSFAKGIEELIHNNELSNQYEVQIDKFFESNFSYNSYIKSVDKLFQDI